MPSVFCPQAPRVVDQNTAQSIPSMQAVPSSNDGGGGVVKVRGKFDFKSVSSFLSVCLSVYLCVVFTCVCTCCVHVCVSVHVSVCSVYMCVCVCMSAIGHF